MCSDQLWALCDRGAWRDCVHLGRSTGFAGTRMTCVVVACPVGTGRSSSVRPVKAASGHTHTRHAHKLIGARILRQDQSSFLIIHPSSSPSLASRVCNADHAWRFLPGARRASATPRRHRLRLILWVEPEAAGTVALEQKPFSSALGAVGGCITHQSECRRDVLRRIGLAGCPSRGIPLGLPWQNEHCPRTPPPPLSFISLAPGEYGRPPFRRRTSPLSPEAPA